MDIEDRKRTHERLNKPKPPTLREIADLAGVAVGTVARMKRGEAVTSINAQAISRALDAWEKGQ